jgi:hypothetical protein
LNEYGCLNDDDYDYNYGGSTNSDGSGDCNDNDALWLLYQCLNEEEEEEEEEEEKKKKNKKNKKKKKKKKKKRKKRKKKKKKKMMTTTIYVLKDSHFLTFYNLPQFLFIYLFEAYKKGGIKSVNQPIHMFVYPIYLCLRTLCLRLHHFKIQSLTQ